jgi:uncharacterized protein (TIGR02147 family)
MELELRPEMLKSLTAQKSKLQAGEVTPFVPFTANSVSELLQKFVDFKKALNPRWSARSWGLKVGFKSPSALFNILKGRRLPERKIFVQMVTSMRLEMKGSDFALCLYEIDLRKRDKEPVDITLKRRLQFLRDFQHDVELKPTDLNYVGSFLSHLLSSLVATDGFREDPKWIQSRIRIPATEFEIETTLRSLLYVGLLKREVDGKLVHCNPFYEVPENIAIAKARKCFEDGLDLAKRSVTELPANERFLNYQVFNIHPDRYEEATQYLKNFRQEFASLFAEPKGPGVNSVFQLNLQLFPLTKQSQIRD